MSVSRSPIAFGRSSTETVSPAICTFSTDTSSFPSSTRGTRFAASRSPSTSPDAVSAPPSTATAISRSERSATICSIDAVGSVAEIVAVPTVYGSDVLTSCPSKVTSVASMPSSVTPSTVAGDVVDRARQQLGEEREAPELDGRGADDVEVLLDRGDHLLLGRRLRHPVRDERAGHEHDARGQHPDGHSACAHGFNLGGPCRPALVRGASRSRSRRCRGRASGRTRGCRRGPVRRPRPMPRCSSRTGR